MCACEEILPDVRQAHVGTDLLDRNQCSVSGHWHDQVDQVGHNDCMTWAGLFVNSGNFGWNISGNVPIAAAVRANSA